MAVSRLPTDTRLLYSPIMRSIKTILWLAGLLAALGLAGCANSGEETAVTPSPSTPTAEPTPDTISAADQDFIVIATDAPNPPFTLFNQFGEVDGFDANLLAAIMEQAQLEYELIVTPYQGVLDNIAANGNRDFDAVMVNLAIPEKPREGIAYTEPYIEVGQVLVVLADEREIESADDIRPEMRIGAVANSFGAKTAIGLDGMNENNLFLYENGAQALQALLDEELRGVIVEDYIADFYTQTLPQHLKIVGGDGRAAWITNKAYAIALSKDDEILLQRLNEAVTAVRQTDQVEQYTAAWLIPDDVLDPGEPRVATGSDEFVIGILGNLSDLDPAAASDLINWEVKSNVMSGLYRLTDDNQIVPLLAADMPAISEDGLEYTIPLRTGLVFPDGRTFTANDVKWSIDRGRSLGNFLINGILKDADENNFADEDAVQVIDANTVKFVLQEPTSYFPSILATPPYFPISQDCFAATWDLESSCGGIGPYTIVNWRQGDALVLQANPDWPGQPAPAFANVTLRFYEDAASMRRTLENFGSIDLAWTGLPYGDYTALQTVDSDGDGVSDFQPWTGPADFKSYVIFNQDSKPWDRKLIRQAANLALDREALAQEVFGGLRTPLLSPVPDAVPGYVPVFPPRDLEQAKSLLRLEGYTEAVPLPVELWFVNDGRYSANEEAYANAIKAQLEETGVFQVELFSAPFEQFRAQVAECNYPMYLLGWPTPGRPVNYMDASAWTDFFVTTNSFCPNYDSRQMAKLIQDSREELDPAARLEILNQMQTLWAEDLPTMDLLQQPRFAISQTGVTDVRIDALGLLHYEFLAKEVGE
ncbi:MAG TPA: transporter substrate-binding domain-containing protein [Anaerolineae bacterium]|nr:transporter substrate-binding domain-containing protein [Anaerolineae bacterium]